MSFDLLSVLPIVIVVALAALAILVVRGQRRKVRDIGVLRSTRTTSAPLQTPVPPQPATRAVAEFPPPKGPAQLTTDERSAIPWLQDIFRSEILEQTGIDLTGDKLAMQRITEAIVYALLELRRNERTNIELPFIAADARGPKHFRRELTRIEAEAARE